MACIYCTPEWFEESAKLYRETPRFHEAFKKLSTAIFYRIYQEPTWGFERDFIFGAIVDKGNLLELRFYNEQETKENAEFLLSATPQEWKLILTKAHKFLTDFMLNKIKLEQGSKVGVLGLAPYADTFIEALTQVKLTFQDDLSPEQLADYRTYAAEFRERLGI